MMLHLSLDRSIPFSQVILLVDLGREKTRDTQAAIQAFKAAGRLQSLGEPAKSMVLVQVKQEQWCYLSPISVRTLFRRVHANLG